MTATMRPEDVPDDLANAAVTAWFGINDKAWGLEGLHRVMRICLAATLPEHERMVVERIACQPPGSVVISEAEYAALTDGLDEIERRIRAKVSDEIFAVRASLPVATIDDQIYRTALVLAARVAIAGPTQASQATGDAHIPERGRGEGSGEREASQGRSEARGETEAPTTTHPEETRS